MRVNERRVQGRKERPTERKTERKEGRGRKREIQKRKRERGRAVSLSTRGRLGIGGEKETEQSSYLVGKEDRESSAIAGSNKDKCRVPQDRRWTKEMRIGEKEREREEESERFRYRKEGRKGNHR